MKFYYFGEDTFLLEGSETTSQPGTSLSKVALSNKFPLKCLVFSLNLNDSNAI